MDAATGLIIFVFVASIFSGFGNKGYTPPPASSAPASVIYTQAATLEPAADFSASAGPNTRAAIEKFILGFRRSDLAATVAESIMRHGQAYDVNPKLITALIARESKFNPRALSSSGAAGLGQLLPSTAKGLGVDDAYDPEQNVKGTTRYFKSLIDRFPGKASSAIAAYLEGPNAIKRNGGFTESTKTYVDDILTLYQKI